MTEQINEFRPAPLGGNHVWREQASDWYSKIVVRYIHQDQCQQESRHCQTDKSQEGKNIVDDRVLFYGDQNADWDGKAPADHESEEGDKERHANPFANDSINRFPKGERVAEIGPGD